jgi:hypothetical protein
MLNRILEHVKNPKPEVGMGATIYYHSDRHAATVTKVSPSGKTIELQEDTAKRVDRHGMSEMQDYTFERNPNGRTYTARLRANGTFKTSTGQGVSLGSRSEYYDFSF